MGTGHHHPKAYFSVSHTSTLNYKHKSPYLEESPNVTESELTGEAGSIAAVGTLDIASRYVSSAAYARSCASIGFALT